MKAGYVRGVYSSAQVQRILQAFNDASCGEVVINVRPQNNHLFTRLLEKLAPGDTLAVWTLGCAAGSSSDLTKLIASLNAKRIGFESIAEGLAVPAGSALSSAMIAARIDRIRSTEERPARRPIRRHRTGGGLAASPAAPALVAAPAR
jgi:DNA invertase Pin-like site-specific DNA recombinase